MWHARTRFRLSKPHQRRRRKPPINSLGGTITGLSTREGGKGITYPVVQEAYDNAPNDKRSDPRMHGRCAKAEALSKGAEKANVTNMEELRKLAKIPSLQQTETTKKENLCVHVLPVATY